LCWRRRGGGRTLCRIQPRDRVKVSYVKGRRSPRSIGIPRGRGNKKKGQVEKRGIKEEDSLGGKYTKSEDQRVTHLQRDQDFNSNWSGGIKEIFSIRTKESQYSQKGSLERIWLPSCGRGGGKREKGNQDIRRLDTKMGKRIILYRGVKKRRQGFTCQTIMGPLCIKCGRRRGAEYTLTKPRGKKWSNSRRFSSKGRGSIHRVEKGGTLG